MYILKSKNILKYSRWLVPLNTRNPSTIPNVQFRDELITDNNSGASFVTKYPCIALFPYELLSLSNTSAGSWQEQLSYTTKIPDHYRQLEPRSVEEQSWEEFYAKPPGRRSSHIAGAEIVSG